MSSATPCCTGGTGGRAANDCACSAIAPGRLARSDQAECLTKALLTVAGHLKSPKNVSNGLFDAGLGIVLIALAESRTSPKYQRLQASSGVDRGRAAIGSVAKWALEMCRAANKSELTLELLRKAENASSATKASLLKRFHSVRNPVSVCRELGTVVKALVRALGDTKAVGDNSNETSTATAGIVLPACKLSSLPTGEALMPRQEESGIVLIALAESRTSLKYRQLQASSGVGRGRAAIGSVAKGALEMCRTANNSELTLELLRKAGNASSATKSSLLKRFHSVRNSVSVCRQLGTVVKALVRGLASAKAVGDNSNETSTATAGTVLPACKISSLPAGEALMPREEELLQTRPTVNSGQTQQTEVLSTAVIAGSSAVPERTGAGAREGAAASGVVEIVVAQADGDDAVLGGIDSVDQTMQDKTATPGEKGGAVDVAAGLDSSPTGGANGSRSLRPTLEKDRPSNHVQATQHVSHKHAPPPAPERRAGCGGGGGGRGGGSGRGGGGGRGGRGVHVQLEEAIKGRAIATLLFSRERQLRKEDARRHLAELEEMRTKLAATEGELSKSQHLVSELRKELGEARSPPANMSTPPVQIRSNGKEAQAAADVARSQCAARLEKLTATWVAFQQSQARSKREPLATVHTNKATVSFDGHANDGDEAPRPPSSSSTSSPKPPTFPAALTKSIAMAPETETGAPDLSSPVAPSSPDKEQSSCESTAMCSTSISPSAPRAPQSDSERSELDGASGDDESGEADSNENISGEDDSGGDYSDHEETGVSCTSASPLSSTPLARADSERPPHLMDNWASCSSPPSTPQARADSEVPPHLMDSRASCSSSPSSSSSSSSSSSGSGSCACSCSGSSCSCSAASSECSEDSEDSEEVRATLSREQVQATSARREVLQQAEGVGFMASLSDMEEGVVTKGKRIGGGGGGDVFEMQMVDPDLQEELVSFTVGAGVVLKTFKKGEEVSSLREIRAMARLMPLCHPNIINTFSTNIEKRTIVMEKVSRDLHALLEDKRLLDNASGEQMVGVCLGAARGLAYMHEKSLVHGDVKPKNIVVSDDLRSVKVIDFGSTGNAGTDRVSMITMAYAAPEVMSAMFGRVVTLDGSMDVWAMAIIILQAITRRTMGPTGGDVLSRHYGVICPTEAAEAFRIAEANVEILLARAKLSRSEADKGALNEARRTRVRMIGLHAGMRAKMSPPEEYMLSPRVWKEQWGLGHLGEVRKLLSMMLNSDPRSRLSMKTVVHALEHPELWVENPALKKAMDAFDTGVSSEPATEATKMNHRNEIAASVVKPLPRDVVSLLGRIEDATGGEALVGPSWSELAGEDGNEWWTKVPAVTALD